MKTITCIFSFLVALAANAQCFQTVSTGYEHSLALMTDGTLWSWGYNEDGELGLNSANAVYWTPAKIGNETDWVKIFAESSRSWVIKSNGTLWGCGDSPLGTGDQDDRIALTQIGTDTDWDFITSGAGTLALKTDGTLWGWGTNVYGMLNLGIANVELLPVQVSTETDWAKIKAGSHHTLAIKEDGTLWACGLNDEGQLGDGTNTNRFNFVQIGSDNDWSDLAAGYLFKHSVAIKADGTFWGWGSNLTDVLGGLPAQVNIPTQLGTDTNWSQVATGYYTTKAIKTDGTLWITTATGFDQIGTDNDWNSIDCGGGHFFAMKTDGTLWGQGTNGLGELGLGSGIEGTLVPTQLSCSAFLGIDEINISSGIKIYPNPASESLFVDNRSGNSINKITMADVMGKVILEETSNFSKINIQGFQNGIYFLIVTSESNNFSFKIVKK